MNTKLAFAKLIWPALLGVSLLTGCVEVREDVKEEVATLTKGPQEAPFRTITDFTPALRCMDSLLIDYGVHDVSMLVEDLKDNTKNVNTGAKDMFISAISEMTRRSHAVRLITFGADSGNLVSFLATANVLTPYSIIPTYDIRGSVSQLDKSVAAKDASAGLNVSAGTAALGIGGAATANASVLALDMSVISSQDYAVIPGVVSKNSIVIFKQGKGLDADARISKFGINFAMSVTRAEGDAQALRNLIELAAVELIGKLTKTPYWSCLGVTADHKEVKDEIYDWFYTLVADGQIVPYLQIQLANRDFYLGPVDGVYSEEFTKAVLNYKNGLGMEVNGNVDLAFFSAVLTRQVPKPPADPHSVPATPVDIDIRYASGKQSVKPSEQFQLIIQPEKDAYVYCYFEDANGAVQRFFPNRFVPDSLVKHDQPLKLPGSLPFKLYANSTGKPERLACFSSAKNVLSGLPGDIKGIDFEQLRVSSLENVETAFARVVGPNLGGEYFEIRVE